MSQRYYKAVRPDGTSFHDPTFRWIPEDWTPADGPVTVTHPRPCLSDGPSGSLSAATVPTDCSGMDWPCCLLMVEPAPHHRVVAPFAYLPHTRASLAWVVVDKLPAHEALGPQGEQVAALIERASRLTRADAVACYGAMNDFRATVRNSAWEAARRAAWDSDLTLTRRAAWEAIKGAARLIDWDTAYGLLNRGLITTEQYDALTLPWRKVVGRIHPDDPEVTL